MPSPIALVILVFCSLCALAVPHNERRPAKVDENDLDGENSAKIDEFHIERGERTLRRLIRSRHSQPYQINPFSDRFTTTRPVTTRKLKSKKKTAGVYNSNVNIHSMGNVWSDFEQDRSASNDDSAEDVQTTEPPKSIEKLKVPDDFVLPSIIEKLKKPLKPVELVKLLNNSKPVERHEVNTEELLVCSNGPRGEDAQYSMSFPPTDPVAQRQRRSAGEPIHTESVHTGDVLTICWIDTVTVKEDNSTEPPKHMVLRDYTITFENGVLIPDEYLECPRADKQINPTTEDELNGTSFHEFFRDDSRRSKVTVVEEVHQEGNLTVTEKKTTRCGSGSLVNKHTYEWLDKPEKAVRRVEIKVRPHMSVRSDDAGNLISTEAPDEVTRVTDDCFIDDTCSTAGTETTPADESKAVAEFDVSTPPDAESTTPMVTEDLTLETTIPTTETFFLDTTFPLDDNGTVVTIAEAETEEVATTIAESNETVTEIPTEPTGSAEETTENVEKTTSFRRDSTRKSQYALKLRVILERVKDKGERETVVKVQKEVALNNTNETFMDQLDALNDSISDLTVIRDLLKCSALESISPLIVKYSGDSSEENTSARRRRSVEVDDSEGNDDIVEDFLPDIREDITSGLEEMKAQISDYPDGSRIRRSADGEDETIGHWSHERFRDSYDGDKVRSFTELLIFENSEDI